MKQIYKTPVNSQPRSKVKAVFLSLFLLAFTQASYAQCVCDATVDVSINNGWPAYSPGQTVCLIGNGGFPVNGDKPDKVCISAGAEVTISNNLNGTQWDISVSGILNYQTQNLPERSTITVRNNGSFIQNQTAMGANGQISDETKLIVESGGQATIAATDIGNLITLQNAGDVEFTADTKIDFKGILDNSGTIVTSAGNNNAILLINPARDNSAMKNSGTINVANFESHVNVAGATFENSGTITARGGLYNAGRMTTTSTGSLNTTCDITSTTPLSNVPANTSFFVGDKEAGSFINRGVFNICGNAVISGLTTLDGGDIFIGGNLDLVKGVTGNDGKLQVGGTATSTRGEGIYSGTNFVFYSPDGGGIVNYPSDGVNYTISTTPLPVKLLSFQAMRSEGAVLISWATTEETNSQNFEVQRSYDAKNWSVVANVTALRNSVVTTFYRYVDTEAIKVTNYYRLKMNDLDGTFAYSGIRSISSEVKTSNAFIYPNPSKGNIKINDKNWINARQVFVYDSFGKVVLKTNATSDELNTEKLVPGMYHLRIIYEGGAKITHSFVVMK